MEKLSETLNPLKPYTAESRHEPDSGRADRVWAQLGELFGKAFYREHGEQPGSLWRQAINRLTDPQIAAGLANLANDGLAFAANLPQFVEAAKRRPPVRQLGVTLLPMSDADLARNADKAWTDMERLAGKKLRPPT